VNRKDHPAAMRREAPMRSTTVFVIVQGTEAVTQIGEDRAATSASKER